MLTDQPLLGRPGFGGADPVSAAESGFPPPLNAYSNDFVGLPLQEENNLWGLSPLSPGAPLPASWNVKSDASFANTAMERSLRNSHVRNGQPTPPPYDDKTDTMNGLAHAQLASTSSDLSDRLQRRSFDEHCGNEITCGSTTSTSKRRKVRDFKASAGGLTPPETDDQHHEKAKREKFLERNRLAASKCRQRKKEHTMLLEARYKEQSDKKETLVAEIARLRSEILGLKNEVLKHAQCGDEPIKLHLAQMVKKITYNDTSVDFTDGAEVASSTESAATPRPPPTTLSFGFDDPLQIDPQVASKSLEQQVRRESESSRISSEASFAFSADDSFDDLINV